jgi:flagellar hook-associated protein 3 FlgL
VASTTIYEMVKFNLGNITEELNKASNVVSTGKRINNLSDDPVGLNQALIIKSTLANIEQMDRNIAFGKTWLVASESAMNHVQDLISDTKSLCIQMATATTSSDARNSAAKTVQNTIDEMVSLGQQSIYN